MPMKLFELSKRIGGRLEGDGNVLIDSVASLADACPQDVSFVSESRYESKVAHSKAGAVIVSDGFGESLGGKSCGVPLIFVDDVAAALERVVGLFAPEPDIPELGVHHDVVIDPSATLGSNVAIGANVVVGAGVEIGDGTVICPGCVIGRDVRIGRKCTLWPNVVVSWGCVLKNNVIIHANSSIGTDGFGYRLVDGEHRKIVHLGIVVIEDNVEIGSNSSVDRAKYGCTVIGRGTKIDNMVQIAHNVLIGEHCMIVSQTGIAGSSELGKYVVLGGQSGVSDHVKVGDGVMAGATTSITSDIEAGAKILGTPPLPVRDFLRMIAVMHKLPEMAKELKRLGRLVEKNAGSKDNS